MTARIIDGNYVASEIRNEVAKKIALRKNKPQLAVVLTGNDPASEAYVRKKRLACDEVGIESHLIQPFHSGINLHKDPCQTLKKIIESLNEDPMIHGILIQLPLLEILNRNGKSFQLELFDLINPVKDVDVFNPQNVGLLSQGRPRYIPCTPAGIQELLLRSGITIAGKKVCIINRSDVVGKPLHSLLVQNEQSANATVFLCHDHTPFEVLRETCLRSDIIVVAVGKPGFLTEDMVSEGSVVIDVGITRVSGTKKIVGDVDFEKVSQKASAISPVPGGVGPCTVACLLRNTLAAFEFQTA